MNYFIDTHAHIYREYYPDTFDNVVKRSVEANVQQIILPGVNLNGLKDIFEAVNQYPEHLFPLVGYHPTDITPNYKEELASIYSYLKQAAVVGIGEIGMDLYHDREMVEEQKEVFYTQLTWACERKLPLSLHIRNAYEEALPILKQFSGCSLKGVLHCFSGGIQEAEWAVKSGFALGIGGVVTFKNNKLQDIVKIIGLQNIVLETDAPFLAPTPHRGETNESSYIPIIAAKIADLFETSVENVMQTTSNTALNIFDKIKPWNNNR